MSLIQSDLLLRQIPKALQAGLDVGDYRVYGSIIRSTSSGRIVGHLQETSAFASLISKGPMAVPELLGQAVAVVQNEQIKASLKVVESLQIAGLALNALSIGVSIAGTAILARRIRKLEFKVDAILPHLETLTKGIEALRQERIVEDFTRLKTLADQVDECWLLDQAQTEWRALSREAHILAGSFARRAGEMISQNVEFSAGEPFLEAFALATSLRVTARLGAGDDAAAQIAAEERANSLIEFGRSFKLSRIVFAEARSFADCSGTPAWHEALDDVVCRIRPQIAAIRQHEIDAAATILTLRAICDQGISGRDWLAAAREEQTSPLLFLGASAS